MSSVLEKLKKNCRIKEAEVLANSAFYSDKDITSTSVPMINVALSGSIDGGLTSGLTVLAGPSKHFKTSFALLMASAYLKKHADACLMFYDSEFGSPQAYFESFGIDTNRVLHIPIKNIEELKFDMVNQLEELDRKDKVIIVIDSVGNLASKKELEDAMNEKSVADMTRAKSLKGLFRMVTPYLTLKNIPLLAVNHTYQTQEMFSKAVVSGGTGITYSADNIWIIGRQQDKEGTEIQGYHFIINVEKSRFVKEKSKIPISVSWEGGIQKWSGLLDVALEGGYAVKPKNGWYAAYDPKTKTELTGNLRAAQTLTKDFWETIFTKTDFATYIKGKYTIGLKDMIDSSSDDVILEEEES
jgi:RecA/RadA recombinase